MSNTPTNNRLPRQVDLRKFAQQGISLTGSFPVSEVNRLSAESLQGDTEVVVEIMCSVDEERHRLITGTADCDLQVTCQRCLEPVNVSLHADVNLAIVWDEERAKQLPRWLDPLILDEGPADLFVVIEDELLLALPMVSYHQEDCIEQTSFGDASDEPSEDAPSNPFQVLEQLKGSPKS